MNMKTVNIIHRENLVNHYIHLTVDAPQYQPILPGQYVTINDFSCYVLGQKNQSIEFILSPTMAQAINNQPTLILSEIQGNPLPPPEKSRFILMLVEQSAICACLFYLKRYRKNFHGLVLIDTQTTFPFAPCPSRQIIPGMPSDVIAALPLLEDWHIAHRLASTKEMVGTYHGCVHDLAQFWLNHAHPHFEIDKIIVTAPD